MGVKSFLKELLCDDDNNITISTLSAAIIATCIVVVYIFGLIYLPYLIITNPKVSLLSIIGMIIGTISWLTFIPTLIKYLQRVHKKYSKVILYTWR